jgi:hypothetical protein
MVPGARNSVEIAGKPHEKPAIGSRTQSRTPDGIGIEIPCCCFEMVSSKLTSVGA